MVAGRSTEPRTATVTTTNASAAITAAAGTFHPGDAGRSITGTGIPAATTIASVTSGTAATLSANATASGSPTATIGAATPAAGQAAAAGYGFSGWSPETNTEAAGYSVAATNAGTVTPDRIANPFTPVTQRSRG